MSLALLMDDYFFFSLSLFSKLKLTWIEKKDKKGHSSIYYKRLTIMNKKNRGNCYTFRLWPSSRKLCSLDHLDFS